MVAALLGPKWLSAVPVLRLLCAYAAMRAIDVLFPPVLFARRRHCLTLLLTVPAAALLGSLWDGAKGVVIFSTPVYCAVMTIMAKEALAELKGGFFELWLELWPIFAACAAMAAVVFLVRDFVAVGRLGSPLVARYAASDREPCNQ